MEHGPLWAALAQQGVERGYIRVLQSSYAGQTATVLAGCESTSFEICRGVKQGDPINAVLFIAVMEAIVRRLKVRWQTLSQRSQVLPYGIVIDKHEDPLTNLRFADDVVLMHLRARQI